MKFKSKISGLVLATMFTLGMASSGLASAQNGGVLPPLPVNGEDIAKEDNAVSSEIVDESFAPAEKIDGKDDSVINAQDSILTASSESPDETQKDDFTASGKTSDASALSEEKSEARDEPLEPAEEANGEDSPVISEQDSLSTVSDESPDETQKDDFTANGKTNSTSATTENLGKGKGSGTVVSVGPAKKKLATDNGKTVLLKGVGTTILAASTVGGVGAASTKLGSSSKAAGANEELGELKKQNAEMAGELEESSRKISELESANKGKDAKIEDLKKARGTSNEGKSGLPFWAIYLTIVGLSFMVKEFLIITLLGRNGNLNCRSALDLSLFNLLDSAAFNMIFPCSLACLPSKGWRKVDTGILGLIKLLHQPVKKLKKDNASDFNVRNNVSRPPRQSTN